MRVDMDVLLPLIKGTEMYKRFRMIAELEKYTRLTPPYEGNAVKKLFQRAQRELNAKLVNDYYWFLKCCDGGLLFTNSLYSILSPDDEENDLVFVNSYLRDEGRIPEGTVAIGTTNYGAYIVIDADGKKEMMLWDPEEAECVAQYQDLYAWLDDVLQEAQFLLENDGLFEIFDDEEGADDVE